MAGDLEVMDDWKDVRWTGNRKFLRSLVLGETVIVTIHPFSDHQVYLHFTVSEIHEDYALMEPKERENGR
jgi:hypothetical protein